MNHTLQQTLITTLILSSNLIANETLDPIIVTSATKTSQNIQDVTSNVDVITAQEIQERHYTTVSDALNSITGISITTNGGTGQSNSLFLRGLSNNKTLVLIDGIRYNDISNSSGAALANVMASDIERIEVVKGSQSGVWGADAAAGVINIITKKAQKGLHFHTTQEFGSFNSSRTEVAGSYKNDNFYLKASQNRIDTQGFTAQAPKGDPLSSFEDDGYKNTTTNLKAGFNINADNSIDVTHSVIDANTDYDQNIYDGWTFNPIKSANSIAKSSEKNSLSSINFNHTDTFNELDVYAKQSTFKRDYAQEFTKQYEGEVKEYGLKSKIPYLQESFLLVGGDYKKFEDKATINQSHTNKALFLTNNNKFTEVLGGTTIVTESLRHDAYNEFDNKTTGKIGLKNIHTNLDGVVTSANYGTAYNVPSSFQLYSFYGNPHMKPEITKGYDVGIAYKDLSLTYFNSEVSDIIDYDFITSKYTNIDGVSKLKGYELAYNTTINDTVALSAGYSKLNAKDQNNETLIKRPESSVKFGVDYYGIEDVHVGLNGEYVGKRTDTDFATYSDVETGKYTVANATANYQVDKHMSVYGKLDNITNKDYQSVYGYATPPRSVYAGMQLTY